MGRAGEQRVRGWTFITREVEGNGVGVFRFAGPAVGSPWGRVRDDGMAGAQIAASEAAFGRGAAALLGTESR